jgi:hypothetical protein
MKGIVPDKASFRTGGRKNFRPNEIHPDKNLQKGHMEI